MAYADDFCCLFNRKAAEEFQLDDPATARIKLLQICQRVVERDELGIMRGACGIGFGERNAKGVAAAFLVSGRRAAGTARSSGRRTLARAVAALWMALGLLFATIDLSDARAERQAVLAQRRAVLAVLELSM